MKTSMEQQVSWSSTPETRAEAELFSLVTIDVNGARIQLSGALTQDGVLVLRDAMTCAVLANLAQVMHRRMREIEIAQLGREKEAASDARGAAAIALGAAVADPGTV